MSHAVLAAAVEDRTLRADGVPAMRLAETEVKRSTGTASLGRERHFVWDDPELQVEHIKRDGAGTSSDALLEFEAVITTARPDRDGDVLEPAGAVVDPQAPLLWQHQAMHPLGRLVEWRLEKRSGGEQLVGRFAVADTPLGRDAAVLLGFGALRISHGFRPLEFEPRGKGMGWHVRRFEIVEVSLVSVPANTDAVITALRRGKLHDPQIKAWARAMAAEGVSEANGSDGRAKRRASVTGMAVVKEKRAMQSVALDTTDQGAEMPGAESTEQKAHAGQREARPRPAEELFTAAAAPRMKQGSELYSTKKLAGRHQKTGEEVRLLGRPVELLSEYETAKMGAYLKRLAKRAGINVNWTEHDELLWQETLERDAWCGRIGSQWHEGLRGEQVKAALLDDATSGGQELNPEFFDAAVVTFPLLHSELLPHVDIQPVPRASSVESASIANPTLTWNHAEGTSLTPFDATALVAAIDTSLHAVVVGIEVGRDFLSDSAVAVGHLLQQNIAERLMSELDKVIAVGNGTTQPQGIVEAGGQTGVNSVNGTTGPLTVTDIESLIFAVGKQYRQPAWKPAFVMNDATYRRARGIAVSGTDETRVFGMSHQDYTLLEYPVRIANDMSDSDIAFGALATYRLYRRSGGELRWYSEGQSLAQKNTSLLVLRARWGGRVIDANAFSLMEDAETPA